MSNHLLKTSLKIEDKMENLYLYKHTHANSPTNKNYKTNQIQKSSDLCETLENTVSKIP